MTHPLPGQPRPKTNDEYACEQWARLARAESALTDEEGYYHGRNLGVVHVIDDEVPDDAHLKGWVW